jgi:chorismate mutase
MAELTNITPPRVDFLDKNGKISREWYRFLLSMFQVASELKIVVEIITPQIDAIQADIDVIEGELVTLTERADNVESWAAQINAKLGKRVTVQVVDSSVERTMIGRLITAQNKMAARINELEAMCLSNQVR